MRNRTPAPRDERPPVPAFTPVPRRCRRHDGWTADRQRAFIDALADTGSVRSAATAVNMAPEGAYALRRAPGAASFREAWAAALDQGVQQLADIAIERARNGVPVPVFHKGEQVGERRWYNDRLLMFILKHHMPNRYGAQIGGGTRSRDTIEREAAENCPECRDRREREAEQDSDAAIERWLDEMLKRYVLKLRQEHECRREGRFASADFYLRQLTHLELILDIGGRSQELIDRFTDRPDERLDRDATLFASELSMVLDEKRRACWEAAGEPPRPPLLLAPAMRSSTLYSDGDAHGLAARHRARREAEERMRHAQAMWDAARTEESWAAWLAANPDWAPS
jgi:hypothetical protein